MKLVVYSIIYRVSYILGGVGFLPSTVFMYFDSVANIEALLHYNFDSSSFMYNIIYNYLILMCIYIYIPITYYRYIHISANHEINT